MTEKGKSICVLAIVFGLPAVFFIYIFIGLFKFSPMGYPNDWGEYVWVSEDPKAFITSGQPTEKGISHLGGQMELDGEFQTVCIRIMAPGDYSIYAQLQTYTVSAKTGRFIHSEDEPQTVFYSKTKYKIDRIICKVGKNSEYFAGQKIVFMRYDKDAVSPENFGFELESWDDFVLVVDSLPGDDEPEPERKPHPTPAPEPTPSPTPGYVRVSASAQGSVYDKKRQFAASAIEKRPPVCYNAV